jgi:hypothetical protein
MKYKTGYKYQLVEDYKIQTSIRIKNDVAKDFISLKKNGMLTILKGFSWDGCSGPTIDTRSTMRGGLIHDALYKLIRWDLLSQSRRKEVDQEFHKIIRADGVFRLRAWYYYQAVRKFGLSSASAENRKRIYESP